MPKPHSPALSRRARAAASILLIAAVIGGSALPAGAAPLPAPAASEMPSDGSMTRIECLDLMTGVYPCAVGEPITLWATANYPAGTKLSYAWYSNGKLIPGAAKSSFTPTDAYKGKSISSVLTGTLKGHRTSVRKSNVLPPLLGRLAKFPDAGRPSVNGTSLVGQALTANPGKFPAGTTFTYQWHYRSGGYINIPGATSKTYKPTASLNGKEVGYSAVAVKPGYRDIYIGSTAAPEPVRTTVVTAPRLLWDKPGVGTALVQGYVLRAEYWKSGAAVKFQWNRAGKPIPGATAATYKTTAADYGKRISLKITGTMKGYPAASAVSAQTEAVGRLKLNAVVLPEAKGYAATGLFNVGGTATAYNGKWNPGATGYTYQWLSNGKAIPGATKSTYKIPASQAGKQLALKISVSRTNYHTYVHTTLGRPVVKPMASPWGLLN